MTDDYDDNKWTLKCRSCGGGDDDGYWQMLEKRCEGREQEY